MSLTAKLALRQIKTNRNRSIMTLLGIALSAAMLTAVCGFVESAKQTVYKALGMDANAPLNFALLAMGAVLGAIIITASVIVVSNAFRVSAGERTRQFGILKSVGATKKQIAASVMYEGVFLSAIGIPVGIAVGLVIELIGTSVITNLMHSLYTGGTLNVDTEAILTVPFAAPPLMFVVAVSVSFGTVLLSAWLPARKAARIPAIDAIRKSGEVALKRKSFRTSKLTHALFGFEGTLAAKSLKRSRRGFRATVLSLTISIVLLIVAGSFGSLMNRSTGLMFASVDATAVADWSSSRQAEYDSGGNAHSVRFIPLDTSTAETITEKLRESNNAEVFGAGGSSLYFTTLPNGDKTNFALVSVDARNYEKLCKAAGVPVGSNILVNLRREVTEGKRREYVPYHFADFAGKTMTFALPGHDPIELTIDGELRGTDIPEEIFFRYGYLPTIIVPACASDSYSWFAKVDDTAGFVKHTDEILKEFAPQSANGIEVYANCVDIADSMKQMRDLVSTIMFFVYGFVGMLTLIAVTSVISTINTNIRSRAGEFAVLQSIGMTKAGVRKMLNLESILCSARSLLYGLPLGLLGSYALYQAMGFSVELPFAFPVLLMVECVLGVFAVTWITMRYAASRLKDGGIVETLRSEVA